jgi:hypothetical protein
MRQIVSIIALWAALSAGPLFAHSGPPEDDLDLGEADIF